MKLLTKKVKILTIYENKFYFLSFLLKLTGSAVTDRFCVCCLVFLAWLDLFESIWRALEIPAGLPRLGAAWNSTVCAVRGTSS